MFGARKKQRDGESVPSLDEFVAGIQDGTREVAGDPDVELIHLLSGRALLAVREDRTEDALADRRKVGELLRGFDGRPLPVAVNVARLAWMVLAAGELAVSNDDAALDAAERSAALMGGLEPDDLEMTAAYYGEIRGLFGELRKDKRPAEALRAAWAAQAVAEALAQADPTRFPTAPAISGVNVALALVDTGQVEDAVIVIADVAARFRSLPGQEKGLRLALSNQAGWLRRLGRWDEALEAEQEALSLARAAALDPADVIAQRTLAARLTGLMMTQVRTGQLAEAEAAAVEALAILVRLPVEEPASGEMTALASALNTLSVALSRAGQLAAAERASARTVELQRELNQAPWGDPGALANALGNQADHLLGLGRPDRAVELSNEALAIFAGLADASFDRYERAVLDTLCRAQAALGHHEAAVASAGRAVAIARALLAQSADHRSALVSSLEVLADRCRDAGDPGAEQRAREEALAVASGS